MKASLYITKAKNMTEIIIEPRNRLQRADLARRLGKSYGAGSQSKCQLTTDRNSFLVLVRDNHGQN